MARRTYTDQEKAAALALLADTSLSFYEVRDQTGIPVGTLHGWAEAAGFQRSDEKTQAATDRRTLRLAAKRQAVAEEFLDRVEDLMGRMDQPHVIGYADGVAVVNPMGASADCKNYMTAAAIALDKFRLEMGEHTSATRTESTGAAEQAKGKLDQLAERRAKKTA